MKIIIAILILSAFTFSCNAQGLSNIWMGGYDNHNPIPWGGWKMDFFTGTPVISYENRNIDFDFTGTNISDSSGNLLFVTNGVIILNNANDTMVNGSGLNPSQYTTSFNDGLRLPQANIIVPKPGNSNQYYLFHATWDVITVNAYADKFYYTIIDMTQDSGRGVVTIKNQVLDTGHFAPTGITACKHGNGRDWWIINHDSYGSDFNFYLLTPAGVTYSHSQTFGFRNGIGATAFSPDGTKYGSYNTEDDFEIFDFDRCTGFLSNYRQVLINDSSITFGCAFSPNSQFLYGPSLRYLYQVDVTSNQPDTTLITVANWDGTYYNSHATTFGLAGLASEGKIYLTTASTTPLMHIIEFPDSAGITCNVLQNIVTLPTYNSATVPNHPNYFLGALTGSPCDTLGVGISEPEILNLKVQPNPSGGTFQVIYKPQPKSGRLQVSDLLGKTILSQPIPPWSQLQNINISKYASGVYVLQMQWDEKSAKVKVVKN